MKKLMIMFLGVAFAACAWAGSYSYVSPYSTIDTTPSVDNIGWYSCYFLTLDNVKTITNNNVQSLDMNEYAAWLGQNFADTKDILSGGGVGVSLECDSYEEDGTYKSFSSSPGSSTSGEEVLAVNFFDDGTNQAYLVGLTETDVVTDFKNAENPNTGWIAVSSTANVPEPTSGLMLLLGLAGLALKRKAV